MQKTTPSGHWIEECSRFTFVENTISNLQKVPRAKFLGSNGLLILLAYTSFAASRTLLHQLLTCLNFHLDLNDSFWFLWTMAAVQVAENHEWVRLDLRLTTRDIYIDSNLNPLTKFTSSSRSTVFKDILPWNIFQMIAQMVQISRKIVISYTMKQGILFWVWQTVTGNWENNKIRISQWSKSHCRTNTSIRKKKQIQKSRTVREGCWRRKVL